MDILAQEHRDADVAERFSRSDGRSPGAVRADKLASCAALNNRVEQSHQPPRVRERRMQRFESIDSAQRFLGVFSRFCNHFRLRRHLRSASEYRTLLQERFQSWREVADVCPAAD